MQELWQDMEEGSHCLHHGPNVRGGWGGVGVGCGWGLVWNCGVKYTDLPAFDL